MPSAQGRCRFPLMFASLFAVLLTACSTVTIKSTPRDAEIYLIKSGQERGNRIGKTPFFASLGEIASRAGDGPVILELRKSGYMAKDFVIPNVSASVLKIETNLTPLAEGVQDVNRIVRLTMAAERQILNKDFESALATAKQLHEISETIASAYAIEGAVQFLKGEFEKSRFSYERTVALDPDNIDAVNMMRVVGEKIGGKGKTK